MNGLLLTYDFKSQQVSYAIVLTSKIDWNIFLIGIIADFPSIFNNEKQFQ